MNSPQPASIIEPERVSRTRRASRLIDGFVTVLAVLVHAALGVTVSVSGLIMPMGAVALLAVFWLGGAAVMIGGRRRPVLMGAVAIASWVVWFVVVWIGDSWLGWTA